MCNLNPGVHWSCVETGGQMAQRRGAPIITRRAQQSLPGGGEYKVLVFLSLVRLLWDGRQTIPFKKLKIKLVNFRSGTHSNCNCRSMVDWN